MNLKFHQSFLLLIIFILVKNFMPLAFSQSSILFSEEEPLEVRITTDLDKLFSNVSEESEKQKAQFQYKNENGKWVKLPITLKLRGNFRKKNCDFPPIQLNFSKSGKTDELFSDQKKIKLVTTCTEKVFLLKEYLVYKTYNLLTDYSLKVRLFKVKFINTNKEQKNVSSYAFLIEDIDELAKRSKAKEFETEKTLAKPLKSEFYNNLFMFHYLVGNSDFLFSSSHNMKIIQLKDSKEKIYIPYDFDWCGFVDPAYKNRIQGGRLDIDLKTRAYRGYCLNKSELNNVFENFRILKPKLFNLYKEFNYLKKKEREEIINYVNEFYTFIENPDGVDSWMKEYCEISD